MKLSGTTCVYCDKNFINTGSGCSTTVCAPGYYATCSVAAGDITCTAIEAGYVLVTDSTMTCTSSAIAKKVAKKCPDNSLPNSDNTSCICKVGYYYNTSTTDFYYSIAPDKTCTYRCSTNMYFDTAT